MGDTKQREGVLVRKPLCRLSDTQVKLIDATSREILEDIGLLCYNRRAGDIFKMAGAKVEEAKGCSKIKIPSRIIDRVVETLPSKIVMGARNPDNRLVLDAFEPRVRFGSGAETNVWLDMEFNDGRMTAVKKEGSIKYLAKAAHLCENLDNLDFFIRCVNIRDREVNSSNKDVNKFLISLNNITKHVQAGLTEISALDDVIAMAEIIAGGKDALKKNPIISFITCVIKSPLQVVDDTAENLIEISKRRLPLVISSCPMGGATGAFGEYGMVAQINAEVLAGIALNQLVAPGAPVLYGGVPVRTRLDTLYDMYGAPEFIHYNLDCAQMARFYGVPCYSTSNVADASMPGVQATFEKMLTLSGVPASGPQYLHYAFGLLEKTNTFCPEQAVLDNEHIGVIKQVLKSCEINKEKTADVISVLKEVMESDHKTFMYHLPLPTKEDVYVRYPLESEGGDAVYAAHLKYKEIMQAEREHLPAGVQKDIQKNIPGVLAASIEAE